MAPVPLLVLVEHGQEPARAGDGLALGRAGRTGGELAYDGAVGGVLDRAVRGDDPVLVGGAAQPVVARRGPLQRDAGAVRMSQSDPVGVPGGRESVP